jgi:hypothetical protein
MSKRIRHMGMTITRDEHERWHREPPQLTPEKHDSLMKKLGITKEEDEEWHRTHLTLREQKTKGLKSVNPFAVGGGFLSWCVKQGWLVQQGKQYLATKEGVRELRKRYEIAV